LSQNFTPKNIKNYPLFGFLFILGAIATWMLEIIFLRMQRYFDQKKILASAHCR
jgi:hypothetical protein